MNAHIEHTQTVEYFAKELSWLSFNERVLQEAKDKNNPIIERMRFLGIFSNNPVSYTHLTLPTSR